MKKPVVAVVFGSRSTEHDVSVVTALAAVIRPLEIAGTYDVLPVYISKDGSWYAHRELGDIGLFSTGKIAGWLARHKPVRLQIGNGLSIVSRDGLRERTVTVDVVFPALHGTAGEDGAAMGLFEMAGVPYVGCGLAASAVAMDKVLTKQICAADGIDVVPYVHFMKHEYEADPDEYVTRINRSLRYPVFVKPAHLGSSIGITRVEDPKDLVNAIEVALHFDTRALVEQGVSNLVEVTLPVKGNQHAVPALLEQPMVHAEDFFDFETKYMHGGKKGAKGGASKLPVAKGGTGDAGAQGYSRIPAELPDALYRMAEETGLRVYRSLGCNGTARVDMLVDTKAGVVYCNEVNPLPGSLYLHNWNKAGVSNVAFVCELVDMARERHDEKIALETTFSTNFLKQF